MSVSLVVNGVTYSYPQTGDQNWSGSSGADGWAQAVTSGMLQKAGGTFTLTADVNFGATFGLISKYFTSVSSNPASAGALRLAVGDTIAFRNNANSGDLALSVNGSDKLLFNGSALPTSGSIVNADISASAAIALTKLANIAAGSVLMGNVSNIPTATALSGDVTINSSGVTAIGANKVTLAMQATLAANSVIGNSTGSTATPTAVALAAAATASTLAFRDGNANLLANNHLEGFQTIATAAGTTTLTVSSPYMTQFTGSTTQTLVLPVASTLTLGQSFFITNRSSGVVTVNSSGGSLVQSMGAATQLIVTCVLTSGTTAASWDAAYSTTSSGTVTSVTFTGDGTVLSSTPSSAVTTTGTVTASLKTQTAATVLAGPTSGGAVAPTFRALVTTDMPNLAVTATKTTTYSIATTDNVILVDPSGGAFTVTLPTAVGVTGKVYQLISVGTGTSTNIVTIATTSAQTIGGASSKTLATANESWILISDGANWQILDHRCTTAWVAYTPAFGLGFGTATGISFVSRRVGDSLEVIGKWTNGTVAGNTASITVGFAGVSANVTIDTAKVPTVGIIGTCQTSLASTTQFGVYPVAPGSNATTIGFTTQNSTTGYGSGAQLGNVISATSSANSVHFIVPIVGWTD